jgi:cbb3-type cytochrome oxidase cytochrome c subunit
MNTGASQLGAPNLTAIGSKHLGIDFQIRHLKCPPCANPGSPMPSFAGFSDQQLHELATFLEASKGVK